MKKVVWLLLDNRMGSVGQIKGIAQALDKDFFETVEKNVSYNMFAALPNCIKGASLIGVDSDSKEQLKAPFPDLVISASRRTATVARYIKKKSDNKTKVVQILHPGNSSLGDYDLIFLPEHDKGKKAPKNVVYTKGSPHRITDKSLSEAKDKWSEPFSHLPKPLTAVVVGGSIKGREFSQENAKKLATEIREFKDKVGGSILITTSKRTGKASEGVIMSKLKGIPAYEYLWGDKGDNPYLGFLACADNIIVTGDSVSMCSEACGTGKPLFIFSGEKWLTPKHHRFIKSLFEGGYATKLDINNVDFKSKGKLNSALDVAKRIRELF